MFRFNFDKKYLYILIGALVLSGLLRTSAQEWLSIFLTLPAVIIAITFHEYAHAFVADKLGDDTPRMQGRLTLNPLSHIDPFGFIMLIFAGIGWGKPVEINSNNFNRNVKKDKGQILVSLAGPITNFLIAIISAIILGIVYMYFQTSFFYSKFGNIIYLLLQEIVIINIGLGVFNLIPLPPLDGSKIFLNLFPYRAKQWIIENSNTFYIIFLILWITGLVGIIISPIIRLLYNGLLNGILAILRLL